MWTYTNSNELYHWGIKGQKWGERRYRNKDGTLTAAGKKRYKKSEDLSSMSDQELRSKINRMQMEKQYKQLTKKEVSAGRKFATGVLVAAATTVATGYATKYMKKGAEWTGKQIARMVKK